MPLANPFQSRPGRSLKELHRAAPGKAVQGRVLLTLQRGKQQPTKLAARLGAIELQQRPEILRPGIVRDSMYDMRANPGTPASTTGSKSPGTAFA